MQSDALMNGCSCRAGEEGIPPSLYALQSFALLLPVTHSASRVGGFTWKHMFHLRRYSTEVDRGEPIYIASLPRAP